LKTPEEAIKLIKNMATSDHAILRDRSHVSTKRSMLELSSQDALLAQNKLLAKQLESLTRHSASCQHSYKRLSLPIHQLCRLEVVVYVEERMNLVVAYP